MKKTSFGMEENQLDVVVAVDVVTIVAIDVVAVVVVVVVDDMVAL